MPFRITADDLDNLSPSIRRQVSPHLDDSEHRPVNCNPQKTRSVNRPEEQDGRDLVTWMDSLVMPDGLRPGLFFFHVPNGLARTAAQGGIFKAQGLRAGWPDYGLMLPLGGYHGFWLEIKSLEGAKPNAEQLDILHRLETVGFKVGVSWGFEDGKEQLQRYMDLAN